MRVRSRRPMSPAHRITAAVLLLMVALVIGDAADIPAAAPSVLTQPQSVKEAVGGNVAFRAGISGLPPPSFQWLKDDRPMAGATDSTLFLPTVTGNDAGIYVCRASNSLGSTATAPARLTVINSFTPGSSVDGTFAMRTPLDAVPSVMVVQDDGGVLVGGSFVVFNDGVAQIGLALLNRDGTVNAGFKPPALAAGGYVSALARQPDGKVLVGGKLAGARSNLVRLLANGAMDPSFAAALATEPMQLLVAVGGNILVVDGTDTLTRLNPDGSVDRNFVKTTLPLQYTETYHQLTTTQIVNAKIGVVALQTDGKIVVGASAEFHSGFVGIGRGSRFTLRRFTADGSLDSSFQGVEDPLNAGSSPLQALRVLSDGRIILVAPRPRRFSSAGVLDSSYAPDDQGLLRSPPRSSAITSDGRVWWFGNRTQNEFFLTRLNPDGRIDSSFDLHDGFAPRDVSAIMPTADGGAFVAGEFTTIDAMARTRIAKVNSSFEAPNRPWFVGFSYPQTIRAGEPFTITARVAGSMPLTYSLYGPTTPRINGSPSAALAVSNPQGPREDYEVTVTGAGGASATYPLRLDVVPSAPGFVQPPAPVQLRSGEPLSLSTVDFGSNPRTYQWFKDGAPIPNATNATYGVTRAVSTDRGDYVLVIRNGLGTVTSTSIHVGVDELPRLANLSTRGLVGTAENNLITGFVLRGSNTKTLLIRGVGPALTAFGVSGVLAAPKLTMYDAAGMKLSETSGWSSAGIGDGFSRAGAFPFAAGSADSAFIARVSPGAYTIQLAGAGSDSGIALLELYELDNEPTLFVNLSSRVFVGTGASAAIPGIVVSGMLPIKLLVRAIGPTLSAFGVQNPLRDPRLTLVGATNTTIATNDNWSDSVNPAEIAKASAVVGAFPLTAGSKDAVVLVTLAPGSYTAQVTGADGGSGIALVEVYEVP